jgi:hypothetical protein
VLVTSPHSTCTKRRTIFKNQIESGEVADQGWTDTGMPKKRWWPGMDISLERSRIVGFDSLSHLKIEIVHVNYSVSPI